MMENIESIESIESIETIKEKSPALFIREAISQLQERMIATPGAMLGDCCPLKHTFAHGLYIREITMPAGILIVTKLHRYSHAAFILQGDVSIMEETGPRRVCAPASFITPAGTKRVVFTHSETIWTTVHATDKTDIKDIEEDIIAKSFEDMDDMEVTS
jgi:hypothetical protein